MANFSVSYFIMINYNEQLTTVETAKDLGLLPEEFEKIKNTLGRVPNFTELSIYFLLVYLLIFILYTFCINIFVY